SKIPVSSSVATSNKRRFSTIPKSTIVPTRQSARIKARHEQLMSNRITTPSSTVAETPSLPNISLANETEVPSSLAMPSPQDLHSSPALPQWVSDIYTKLNQQTATLSAQAAQIAELHHLVQRNVELQTALDRALQRIDELEQATATSNASLSPSTAPSVTVQPDSTVPAVSYAAVAASADSVTTSAPAQVSHRSNTSRSTNDAGSSTRQPKREKKKIPLETSGRFFSTPPVTHGYQFMYFPCRGKDPIHKLRRNLSNIGLQNSRILDVHYPDNHIVALLIHNDYNTQVLEAFARLQVLPIVDFDPRSPTNLKDP
ncbi:hypothetical protein, partial, partial [Parasitella parasitica]